MRAHHILEEIVVRVGVALRAARVFMTKPFAYAIEPGTVVVEPRCACVAKVMDTTRINAGSIERTDVPPVKWPKFVIYVRTRDGYVIT